GLGARRFSGCFCWLCLGSFSFPIELGGRGLLKATRTGNLRHAERGFELRGLLRPDVITERIHFS
ncbi:hypothetical protein, partial [Pseudomonas syringae]|uniref:hypothetical protein n=1 Tax=Pseudomonas syringae TaxID=317 RepID=UPI001E5E4CA1